MSLFADFTRLQDSVNQLMGDFSGGLMTGGVGSGRRHGGRGRGSQGHYGGFGFGPSFGLSDPFFEDPFFSDFDTLPLLMGVTGQPAQQVGSGDKQSQLLAGGKGPGGENEMKDAMQASGTSTAVTTQQQAGHLTIPTLRCRVNVEDQKDKLVVTAEVPGFDKSNLKVNISDDNVLSISGEQKKEHIEDAKDKKFYHVERSFGHVRRSMQLPKNIDRSKVSASYENGILHIDVPKKAEEEKKSAAVNIA